MFVRMLPDHPLMGEAMALIEKSIAVGSGETRADIDALISSRVSLLFASIEGGHVVMAIVMQLQILPTMRRMFLQHMAARQFEDLLAKWEEIDEIARHAGASSVACCALPAAARLYRMKIKGAKHTRIIVEKDL